MSLIKKIFRRKKPIPLACSMTIENEEGHVHTDACFLDLQPLSVVELFQSQGCASCPQAIPKIHEGTADSNLVLLTYNVTYFDHTGWTDTHAKQQWDQRHKAYVKKWGRTNLFTPQVIVDGIADGTVASAASINEIVSHARNVRSKMDWSIIIDTNDTQLRVDSNFPEAEVHDILIITYEPKSEIVKVKKGANKGIKMEHRNVVKAVMKVGEWRGGNITIDVPGMGEMANSGVAAVAVVQAPYGGPILTSQKV